MDTAPYIIPQGGTIAVAYLSDRFGNYSRGREGISLEKAGAVPLVQGSEAVGTRICSPLFLRVYPRFVDEAMAVSGVRVGPYGPAGAV